MTSTEVATKEPTALVPTGALQDLLAGAGADDISIDTVKVPSGGSVAWELPSGDPSNPRIEKEFRGVVVDDYSYDALYLSSYDQDPDSGANAVWIAGQFAFADDQAVAAGVLPGESVHDQPLNQWGSAPSGKGKAISNRWSIFIVEEGQMLPVRLAVPPMSRKLWFNYKLRRFAGRPTTSDVTRFTLQRKENNSGQPYSEIVFGVGEELDPAVAAQYAQLAVDLKPLTTYRVNATQHTPQSAPTSGADALAAALDAKEITPDDPF